MYIIVAWYILGTWPFNVCNGIFCLGHRFRSLHHRPMASLQTVSQCHDFIHRLTERRTQQVAPDRILLTHQYGDVIISTMGSQITSLSIVCFIVCSGTDQRKHHGSASLAFVKGIQRWPENSPHKAPVTRKMFPFDVSILTVCQLQLMVKCNPNPTPTPYAD